MQRLDCQIYAAATNWQQEWAHWTLQLICDDKHGARSGCLHVHVRKSAVPRGTRLTTVLPLPGRKSNTFDNLTGNPSGSTNPRALSARKYECVRKESSIFF
eukprot:6202675-Pleurochrysis_carterae.AAC.2